MTMSRKIIIFCMSFVLFVSATQECNARWALVILKNYVKESPIIVVGKIDSIKVAEPINQHEEYYDLYTDMAFIAVDSVLKNTLPDFKLEKGDKIPLLMWSSLNNVVMFPSPIQYGVGYEGIWILNQRDSTFSAYHPIELQPMSKLEEICGYLREQERETVGDSLK